MHIYLVEYIKKKIVTVFAYIFVWMSVKMSTYPTKCAYHDLRFHGKCEGIKGATRLATAIRATSIHIQYLS